ncbi:MAG TPA: hypothetical protein VF778_05625 [Xanthobacteraceae bacterium]
MTNSAVQAGGRLLRASAGQVFERCLPRPAMAIAAAWLVLAVSAPAHATTIERVVSPGGVKAWLVHEPAVPLITVEFAFAGGAVQDPPGKAGTANLTAALLDAGAGDLDSKAFSDRL